MKKFTIATLFITALLLLSACSPGTEEPTLVLVASGSLSLVKEGRLLPVNSLDQSFTTRGQVAEVMVKDGDSVTAGQPLARLSDSPEAQAALARAQLEALASQQALDLLLTSADLNLMQSRVAYLDAKDKADQAKIRYDAIKSTENQVLLDAAAVTLKQAEDTKAKLESGNGVDPDKLAAAKARLVSANAALTSAQAAVDALVLKASMNGSIVDLSLQAGQQVASGAVVMVVADFSQWVVKLDNLTEKEIVSIKVGQKVEIALDALPTALLTGEVNHINMRFEENHGYSVTILVNRADPRMRWGMTAKVSFFE